MRRVQTVLPLQLSAPPSEENPKGARMGVELCWLQSQWGGGWQVLAPLESQQVTWVLWKLVSWAPISPMSWAAKNANLAAVETKSSDKQAETTYLCLKCNYSSSLIKNQIFYVIPGKLEYIFMNFQNTIIARDAWIHTLLNVAKHK